ncbi:hypothetical protein VNO77_39115 [Canavalia gladiata]|uniref:Uncharacterized protein n=1 Tax=Canavalia gladiata TaxID=3824 RepID=A0AAN9PVJ6_CANGL
MRKGVGLGGLGLTLINTKEEESIPKKKGAEHTKKKEEEFFGQEQREWDCPVDRRHRHKDSAIPLAPVNQEMQSQGWVPFDNDIEMNVQLIPAGGKIANTITKTEYSQIANAPGWGTTFWKDCTIDTLTLCLNETEQVRGFTRPVAISPAHREGILGDFHVECAYAFKGIRFKLIWEERHSIESVALMADALIWCSIPLYSLYFKAFGLVVGGGGGALLSRRAWVQIPHATHSPYFHFITKGLLPVTRAPRVYGQATPTSHSATCPMSHPADKPPKPHVSSA